MELQYNRSFILSTSDGQSSKPYMVKNGVAQGSVLASVLYNIYTSDFPATTSDKYTDDIVLMTAAHVFEQAESILTDNMAMVQKYLRLPYFKYLTNPILKESNPDSSFELLISNYNQAFVNHFPLLSNKAKSRNNPWFNQELTELKRQKDKLYKKCIIKQSTYHKALYNKDRYT